MSKWAELEKLAKAATPGVYVVKDNAGARTEVRHLSEADRAFVDACTPATVLELLATIASLRAELEAEREAKAEVEQRLGKLLEFTANHALAGHTSTSHPEGK